MHNRPGSLLINAHHDFSDGNDLSFPHIQAPTIERISRRERKGNCRIVEGEGQENC